MTIKTPTLFRTDEVADALRVTPRTVRRWAAEGRIGSVRVGRYILIPRRDFQRLLREKRQAAKP